LGVGAAIAGGVDADGPAIGGAPEMGGGPGRGGGDPIDSPKVAGFCCAIVADDKTIDIPTVREITRMEASPYRSAGPVPKSSRSILRCQSTIFQTGLVASRRVGAESE
jgi:hypothetical protein